MSRKAIFILLIIFTLSLPSALSLAQDPLPALADLNAEAWNQIMPGGETMCSDGSEFSFFARPQSSDKLMIYLNGGGACWNGTTCKVGDGQTYIHTIADHNIPDEQSGLFEFSNEMNPVSDYDVIFIPYCTGDVHVGTSDVEYTSIDGESFTIHHHGYQNVSAVLDWVYANYENPTDILVTGSSGGAIPSPFYALSVAEHYPDSTLTVFGDGAGGYRNPDVSELLFSTWGTEAIIPEAYQDETISTLNFEDFYIYLAEAYPDVHLGQFNNAFDSTQTFFSILTGSPASDINLKSNIELNIADIEAVAPVANYMAGGDAHTVLRSPDLYLYDTDGRNFAEWFRAFITGESMDDAICGGTCGQAELPATDD
ncbi:pectin acetylesterase-family hydrolase [Anaerolineales bacterium]